MAKKLFVDLEASSLSWHSYPIEIAWGSSLDDITSYLISPESINEWTDWSMDAQDLHGISRSMLIERGTEPEVVCREFMRASEGLEVYTNNPCWDAMWLYKLFFFAKQKIPIVNVRHFDELLINTVCPRMEKRLQGLYSCIRIKTRVSNEMRRQHRAGADVEYLIRTYNLVEQMECDLSELTNQ